jgi:lipopolysaccharide transport system permease protein
MNAAPSAPVQIHTHIDAQNRWFQWSLRDLWKYRDLIVLFAKKSLTVTYKQTILGPLWLLLNPVISSFVYMVLFGHIARLGTEGVPEMLFYLTGTAAWGFFSTCFSGNSTIFVSNAHLFGKIWFPRLTVPLANILTALVKFGVQLIPALVLLLHYTLQGVVHPDWRFCLLLPVTILQLALLALGCGLIVSSATAKYRDLNALVPVGTQLWMYATPVVYPLSVIPAGIIRRTVLINPVTACMELFRKALLGVGTPYLRYVACSWTITVLVLIAGLLLFHRVERNFLDTV